MRRISSHFLIIAAMLTAGAGIATTAAEAAPRKKRPLIVKVQPRSYFDAGKVVSEGSLSQYARGPHYYSQPVYSFNGSRFGESTLPDRIGSGVSPFGRF
jgi:hypothetical protein